VYNAAVLTRPPERPHTTFMQSICVDLSSQHLEIHEAIDLVQIRPLWKLTSLYSATHSQWCMLLLDWSLRCSSASIVVNKVIHKKHCETGVFWASIWRSLRLIWLVEIRACMQRQNNHSANCAVIWAPVARAPGLDAFMRRRWRTVLRYSPAVVKLCDLFGWVHCCTWWENVLNVLFTVCDDLIKHLHIIWGPGPHVIWHGASQKLNPALHTCIYRSWIQK